MFLFLGESGVSVDDGAEGVQGDGVGGGCDEVDFSFFKATRKLKKKVKTVIKKIGGSK